MSESHNRTVADVRKSRDAWSVMLDMIKRANSADVNAACLPDMAPQLGWYFDVDLLLREIDRRTAAIDALQAMVDGCREIVAEHHGDFNGDRPIDHITAVVGYPGENR